MKAQYPGNLADELFELEARAADLARSIKAVKQAIASTGQKAIEGIYARATVSVIEDHWIFDAVAGRALLERHNFEVPMTMRSGSIRVQAKARIPDPVARPMMAAE